MPDPELDLDDIFTYHAPDQARIAAHQAVRDAAHRFAELIVTTTPTSRETLNAINAIEESVFWTNAAIARNGLL